MMLELWNAPVSTCSQKVRMALFEKGLPWKDRRIEFARNDHLSDWYLALNPNGVVPTLVHDGDSITDSSVIGEYLDDVFTDPPLRPADPKALAAMRAWRQYVDEVPTPAIRIPSFQLVFRRIWADRTEAEFLEHADRLPLRKHFYRKMADGGFSDAEIGEAMDKLEQTIDRMEARLASGGPWMMGTLFTLADICVMPTIVRLHDLGLTHLWNARPRVAGWLDAIMARPAFARTYPPEARALTPAC